MATAILAANWVRIGNRLGVDFINIPIEEWIKGCDHELEHWETVKGNPLMIAGIALDHLREDKDYYKKLEQVEHE